MHDWVSAELGSGADSWDASPAHPLRGGLGWNILAFRGSAQFTLGRIPAVYTISRSTAVFRDSTELGLAAQSGAEPPIPEHGPVFQECSPGEPNAAPKVVSRVAKVQLFLQEFLLPGRPGSEDSGTQVLGEIRSRRIFHVRMR